ncbi:hypothetical protein BLJAPNOD_05176 [Ensifer sp. M14]|nr:hypothetical protein BLJAPNOD_05176 [Ensifer sp. M14]
MISFIDEPFLVLPPDRLLTYSRWLRLLVTQSLLDMAREAAKPDLPVLYLLDEFAALGYLAPVERAMGLMTDYGVQLWPILQDVHQLRAIYGKREGTFHPTVPMRNSLTPRLCDNTGSNSPAWAGGRPKQAIAPFRFALNPEMRRCEQVDLSRERKQRCW